MERVTLVQPETEKVNSILAKFSQNDERVNALYEQISQTIENGSQDPAQYCNTLISTEYLVTRIRTIVSSEQMLVKQALMIPSISPKIAALFKTRDSYLGLVNQRLNELREDATVIQKLVYSKTFTDSNFRK